MSTIEEVRVAEKRVQNILEALKKAPANDPNHLADESSGVTSKAANGGHFKTGQRKWPRTRLFYSAAS